MEDVVAAPARDVGGDRGREIRRRDVVHFDRDLVLLGKLLREDVEPLVVVGYEVLPVNDLQDSLLLRRSAAGQDRRRGECRAGRQGDLEKLAAAETLFGLVLL